MPDRQWPLVAMTVAFCLTACLAATTRCKPKYHYYTAVNPDLNGKRCWDLVKMQSCGGYCLSYETPHWQFPYKKSHHPVCVQDDWQPKFVKLRNCDPGVEPGTEDYHYREAASCKCKACSSDDTSCEWLPPDSNLLKKIVGTLVGDSIEEELDQLD